MPKKKYSKTKAKKGNKQTTPSSQSPETESNTLLGNNDIDTDSENLMPMLEAFSDNPTQTNTQNAEIQRIDNSGIIIENLWEIVPTFAGSSSESDISLVEFLENFEEISRVVNCSESTKLFLLKRKLLGEAKGVIFNNPHLKVSKSYKEIVQALKEHFLSKESRAKKMKEFLDIYQMPGESVKKFACRLKAASYFAFPECINSEKEEEFRCEVLCETFQSHLDKDLQELMSGRVITSFESALKLAQFEEKYIQLKNQNRTQQQTNVINTNNENTPIDLNNPEEVETFMMDKLQSLEKHLDNVIAKNVPNKNTPVNLNNPEEVEKFLSDKVKRLEKRLDEINNCNNQSENDQSQYSEVLEPEANSCSIRENQDDVLCRMCGVFGHEETEECHIEQNMNIFCEICQSRDHWTNQCEQGEELACNFCGAFDHTEEFCDVGEEEYEEMCDACGNFGHSENLCPVQNSFYESPKVTETCNQKFYRDASMQNSPYYNVNRSFRRNRNKIQKTYLFKNNSPTKNLRHWQNSNKFSVKRKQMRREFRCRKYQNKNWTQNKCNKCDKNNDKEYTQQFDNEIDILGRNTPTSDPLLSIVEGKIFDSTVHILLSTGSSYNVIYKDTLNAVAKTHIKIRKQQNVLQAFNASDAVTSEVVSLQFSIGNHKFQEEFIVLQSPSPVSYDLFLGFKFFIKNSVTVNFPKNKVCFPDFTTPFVGWKDEDSVTHCDTSVQTEPYNIQQNNEVNNVNRSSEENSVSQNLEVNKNKQKDKTQNYKTNKINDDSGMFGYAGKAVNRLAFRPNTETSIKIKMNATFEKGELIEVKQLNYENELLIENSIIRVEGKCFWVKVKNISDHVVLVDRGSDLVTIEAAKNHNQNCINSSDSRYSNHVNTESNISPEVTFLEEKKSNLSDYAVHPQFLNIIREEQNKDRKCNVIKLRLQNGEKVHPLFFHFFVENGILKCRNRNPRSRQQNKSKIVLPHSLMQEVIESCHDAEKETHAGFRQTLFRITESYSWKDMYHHILYYVNNCQNCYEQYYNRMERREASFRFKERNRQFNNFSPKLNQCNKCFKTKVDDKSHNYANHQKNFYESPKKQNNDKVFNLNDRVYICKHGNPQQTDWCRGEFRISRIISSNVFEIQNERYLWKKLIVQADRLFKCNKQTNNSNFSCNFEPNHRASCNQNHYHDRMVVNSSCTSSPNYRVPKGYNYFPSPINDE